VTITSQGPTAAPEPCQSRRSGVQQRAGPWV